MMKVLVTTPYERNSLQGNTVTAMRIGSILLEAGLDATVVSKGDEVGDEVGDADVMIALHAKKSAHFIDDFLKVNPTGEVIVYLTGTDLYGDVPNGCSVCEKSMQVADALVVSQESSLESVPEKHRAKSVVVHKSIQLPESVLNDGVVEPDLNLFSFVGHLRSVKQPFMAVESIRLLDDSVRLMMLGKEVDSGSGEILNQWQDKDPRVQWLGGVEYVETLRWMRRSVATVNTSLVEGGANSVGESIVLGVPVLASKIEGNVGMLGDDYSGYFSADSTQELADLMARVMNDGGFLKTLREQVNVRAKIFLRENEKQDWLKIIKKVT